MPISQVTKLTPENYHTSKISMQALLMTNNTWGIVNGTTDKSTVGKGCTSIGLAHHKTEWEALKQLAYGTILLGISGAFLYQFRNSGQPVDLWEQAVANYTNRIPSLYQLRGNLYRLKLVDKGIVEAFVAATYRIRDDITMILEAGECRDKPDSGEISQVLLSEIPDDWKLTETIVNLHGNQDPPLITEDPLSLQADHYYRLDILPGMPLFVGGNYAKPGVARTMEHYMKEGGCCCRENGSKELN